MRATVITQAETCRFHPTFVPAIFPNRVSRDHCRSVERKGSLTHFSRKLCIIWMAFKRKGLAYMTSLQLLTATIATGYHAIGQSLFIPRRMHEPGQWTLSAGQQKSLPARLPCQPHVQDYLFVRISHGRSSNTISATTK